MLTGNSYQHAAAFALQSRNRQRRSQRRDGPDHVHLRHATVCLWLCRAFSDRQLVRNTAGRADLDCRDYGHILLSHSRGGWTGILWKRGWQRYCCQQHVHLYQGTDGGHKCRRRTQFMPFRWIPAWRRRNICVDLCRNRVLRHCVAAHPCIGGRRRRWRWHGRWGQRGARNQRHPVSLLFWNSGFKRRWRRWRQHKRRERCCGIFYQRHCKLSWRRRVLL